MQLRHMLFREANYDAGSIFVLASTRDYPEIWRLISPLTQHCCAEPMPASGASSHRKLHPSNWWHHAAWLAEGGGYMRETMTWVNRPLLSATLFTTPRRARRSSVELPRPQFRWPHHSHHQTLPSCPSARERKFSPQYLMLADTWTKWDALRRHRRAR